METSVSVNDPKKVINYQILHKWSPVGIPHRQDLPDRIEKGGTNLPEPEHRIHTLACSVDGTKRSWTLQAIVLWDVLIKGTPSVKKSAESNLSKSWVWVLAACLKENNVDPPPPLHTYKLHTHTHSAGRQSEI